MKNKSLINMILYIGIVFCMFLPGAIEISQTLITSSGDWGWGGRSMGSSSVSMLGVLGKIGGLNTVLIIVLLAISLFGAVSCWRESKGNAISNVNFSLYIAIAEAVAFSAFWISIDYNHTSNFYWVYPNKYIDTWDVDTVFYLILLAVCVVLGISIWEYVIRKRNESIELCEE